MIPPIPIHCVPNGDRNGFRQLFPQVPGLGHRSVTREIALETLNIWVFPES